MLATRRQDLHRTKSEPAGGARLDEDRRALERAWRADPHEPGLRQRLIAARRRARVLVPDWLDDPHVAPGGTFDSHVPLRVVTLHEDGTTSPIGRTPGVFGPLDVPGSLPWLVTPLGDRHTAACLEVVRERRVPGLSLGGREVRDGLLRDISSLSHLRALQLHACRGFAPDALVALVRLRALEELDLGGCCIGPEHAAALTPLRQLSVLRLRDCPWVRASRLPLRGADRDEVVRSIVALLAARLPGCLLDIDVRLRRDPGPDHDPRRGQRDHWSCPPSRVTAPWTRRRPPGTPAAPADPPAS